MQGPQTDPVANPVRLALVRRLLDGDATLDELAEAAGVHRNTARAHADALERAGLIERAAAVEQKTAGRPRTTYRLTSAALGEPRPLAQLLGAALMESGFSQGGARRVARLRAAAASRLAPRRRRAGVLEGELARLGLRAQLSAQQIELDGCPCPIVAPGDPALVCALILGTIDGILEQMGSAQRVIDGAHDPAARHCTLRIG